MGFATPPSCNRKRMAFIGQLSWQLRHSTRFSVRHCVVISTLCVQGSSSNERKIGCSQTKTHFWQNVHSPLSNCISGKPPSPFTIIWVSHTSMQSPHRVHFSVKSLSFIDQGGRIALIPWIFAFSECNYCKNCPRNNCLREGFSIAIFFFKVRYFQGMHYLVLIKK